MAGRSFAFDGVGGTWQWCEHDGRKLAISEIREQVQRVRDEEGEIAASDFRAMITEKLKRAERGALVEPDEGRSNLVLVSGVKEIKWRIRHTNWRLYYAEPLHLNADRVMLGLLFRRKDTVEQQDADITEAGRRWACWKHEQRG